MGLSFPIMTWHRLEIEFCICWITTQCEPSSPGMLAKTFSRTLPSKVCSPASKTVWNIWPRRRPYDQMTKEKPHISVCICTYKRPALLRRLLEELGRQETGGLFTFSIIVADNDASRSADAVVSRFGSESNIPIW